MENTVGKGEIALNKQFLLFPKCFQNACFPGASKGVIVWEWVNHVLKLCKMQFSTVCSLWFMDCLPFHLEIFIKLSVSVKALQEHEVTFRDKV